MYLFLVLILYFKFWNYMKIYRKYLKEKEKILMKYWGKNKDNDKVWNIKLNKILKYVY